MEQFDREKQAVRARLLEQFNRVLPTTDTPRGLVVNMGDVLFDAGKSDLRPEAREALAKLSGVVLNYPSLRLTIEGHTDNTGRAEINQTVSEQPRQRRARLSRQTGTECRFVVGARPWHKQPSRRQRHSRGSSKEPPRRNHRLRGGYRNPDRTLRPIEHRFVRQIKHWR